MGWVETQVSFRTQGYAQGQRPASTCVGDHDAVLEVQALQRCEDRQRGDAHIGHAAAVAQIQPRQPRRRRLRSQH